MNVINDPPDWQALEIHFTDRTLLHFEFTTTHTEFKPKYLEARRGDLELIRTMALFGLADGPQVRSQVPAIPRHEAAQFERPFGTIEQLERAEVNPVNALGGSIGKLVQAGIS